MTKYFTSTGQEAAFTKEEDGKFYTNAKCDRCQGLGIINDPRYMRYTAGGKAGGCFACNATGKKIVRAYTEKQYASIERSRIRRQIKTDAQHEADRLERKAKYDAQAEEYKAQQEQARKKIKPIIKCLSPLVDAIADGEGGFCDSIARDMANGHLPRGRGVFLVCDIISKKEGRANSKAYKAEFDRIDQILTTAMELV